MSKYKVKAKWILRAVKLLASFGTSVTTKPPAVDGLKLVNGFPVKIHETTRHKERMLQKYGSLNNASAVRKQPTTSA